MPKTNPNLQPERYEPVVFTWHSALLVGTIVLAVVNSVKEVNYFVLAAESAVGVISAYFTAKTLGHNYYVEKRNKVRGGLQRELENAKGAIGISDELQDQDIRVNLAEMGNISRKMTDRQMMQKYSQNYTTQNHRRLERALNEVESLTARVKAENRTSPSNASFNSLYDFWSWRYISFFGLFFV